MSDIRKIKVTQIFDSKNLRFTKESNVIRAERHRRSKQGKNVGTWNSPIREDVRNCNCRIPHSREKKKKVRKIENMKKKC